MNELFPVDKNAYLAFDGLSIRDKIRERLEQTGVFSDQAYEGSNLSALNDVISMVFSLLIYNLNKSSANGQFSETTVYENISKIVKALNYNPIGHQTPILNYTLTAKNLSKSIYTIPRYSFLSVGGIKYSLTDDISFNKTVDITSEEVIDRINSKLLYQGEFREFPAFTTTETPNELIYLTVDDRLLVDHFNTHVYVREPNKKWTKWTQTTSLYLSNAEDTHYELRFNEKKRYEIKLGNNINGRMPIKNSEVAIYYLVTSGSQGEMGSGVLTDKSLILIGSSQLSAIISDTGGTSTYIDEDSADGLSFFNVSPSTYYAPPETVSDIRKNAPSHFRSQFSLTTEKSFESHIRSNFANIIHDVAVLNNVNLLDTYTKYFYSLGLTSPHLEHRSLFNHLRYADACNFNNIYCFCVPKTRDNTLSFIFPEQKDIIINSIQAEKVLTSEVVIMDPVYVAFDIGFNSTRETVIDDIATTHLVIKKSLTTRKSDDKLKEEINGIIVEYFNKKNCILGQVIDISQLVANMISLEGVNNIYTLDTVSGVRVEGMQWISWNPMYKHTVSEISNNTTLDKFQFPFLYTNSLLDRIQII